MNTLSTFDIKCAYWDSENFNVKVGALQVPSSISLSVDMLHSLQKMAKKDDYELIYIMLSDNRTIQMPYGNSELNLLFVDKKTTYTKIVTGEESQTTQIRSFKDSDSLSELYLLAIESGKHSRFKLDFNFSPEVFEKMYRIWIERSVRKEIADDVLVYEEADHLRGMLTYKQFPNKAIIGLIAVSPVCQNLGIGSKLMKYLELNLFRNGITELEVVTQGHNLQACQFYERNNFNVKDVTNIYHLWL